MHRTSSLSSTMTQVWRRGHPLGRVNMPTAQKLADCGLTYSQWHTTAICSPTRSTCPRPVAPSPQRLLRNHRRSPTGFPGHHGRIPRTMRHRSPHPSRMRVGVPTGLAKPQRTRRRPRPGGYKRTWPLQQGFDRFYGFLGGETNQWYPDLVERQPFIDQPYLPRMVIISLAIRRIRPLSA